MLCLLLGNAVAPEGSAISLDSENMKTVFLNVGHEVRLPCQRPSPSLGTLSQAEYTKC